MLSSYNFALCLERFYLVLWPDEDTVSVHPEAEVMEPALEQCVVGSCCSIQFGRSKYKGKIACIGKFLCCNLA